MSMQRTPTKDDSKSVSLREKHASSTPNLNEIEHSTMRPLKRKQNDDCESMLSRMEEMLNIWQSKQEKKMETFLCKISDKQLEIHTSMEFISKQYEDMKVMIETLLEEKKENKLYIKSLESRIEKLEKRCRSSTMEIRNVPVLVNETASSLSDVIFTLGKVAQVPIEKTDIKNLFRMQSSGENKPIIVEFTSDLVKDNLLQSIKQFNRTNKGNFLKSSDLGIPGTAKQVYVSESLTANAKKLFYLTRNFAKSYDYNFAWTSHGNIFVRRRQGDPAMRIGSEEDLQNLATK
ncbi:uncharacterized protein LOC128201753 [Galleria mellonella]|uniref:Uncharacterized protein LOC128201753 n=1 Tax=Galleria mellonella TaxID=7137 RepID=A0ABM3MW57_GALME|nr:uncharacterized protein LOC128201753 [Galleria mellonella]